MSRMAATRYQFLIPPALNCNQLHKRHSVAPKTNIEAPLEHVPMRAAKDRLLVLVKTEDECKKLQTRS